MMHAAYVLIFIHLTASAALVPQLPEHTSLV